MVSLALVGKVAGPRPGKIIGLYSFLVALGFMGAFARVKASFESLHADWRTLWAGLGWVLVGFGVLTLLIVREPRTESPAASESSERGASSYTLSQAIATPAFWVFALATSFYGLVAAGLVAVQPVPARGARLRPRVSS